MAIETICLAFKRRQGKIKKNFKGTFQEIVVFFTISLKSKKNLTERKIVCSGRKDAFCPLTGIFIHTCAEDGAKFVVFRSEKPNVGYEWILFPHFHVQFCFPHGIQKVYRAGQFVCKHPEVGPFFSALVQKKKTHFLFRHWSEKENPFSVFDQKSWSGPKSFFN